MPLPYNRYQASINENNDTSYLKFTKVGYTNQASRYLFRVMLLLLIMAVSFWTGRETVQFSTQTYEAGIAFSYLLVNNY